MIENSEEIEFIFENFIETFILKEKQERLNGFLGKKKNWWKLKLEFHSSSAFDTKKLIEIKPNDQYAEQIYIQMKELGANENCISLLEYLDNKPHKFTLKEKLKETVGFLCETILYCSETKIGYFEGGHPKDRFILKAK